MKLIKTANGNKLKISHKEWESIGKTAGWMKTAKFVEVDYFSGFGEEKRVKMRLDPGEGEQDVIRRLKRREKGQDVTITRYFPIGAKSKKGFSLKDQAHQRGLQRQKERERRRMREEMEKQQKMVEKNKPLQLMKEIEQSDVTDEDWLSVLRSRKLEEDAKARELDDLLKKRVSTMKYKLTKEAWDSIGKQAGWMKISMNEDDIREDARFYDSQRHQGGKLVTRKYHQTTVWMMLYDDGSIEELHKGDLEHIEIEIH